MSPEARNSHGPPPMGKGSVPLMGGILKAAPYGCGCLQSVSIAIAKKVYVILSQNHHS